MNGAGRTYDAMDVSIIVNNVHLTGLGEDLVSIEKDEEHWTTKVGAQGDVVRSKINNPLHTITVTLEGTSPQVGFMDALARTGEMFPISVMYSGETKETNVSTQAFIKKPAARTYGAESEDREYEIQCMDMEQT